MEVLKRGAEAIIFLDREKNLIIKERIKKSYRIDFIDKKIRAERTRREAKIISDARRVGVNVPRIFEVDEDNCKIYMENIEGILLKEFLNEIEEEKIKEIMKIVGKQVGRLHSNDIIHGDLTTSNMIVKNNEVYFIDFGLAMYSKRIEDKAVDLRLFLEALKSVHFKILDICWQSFLEGYKEEFKEFEKVLEQLKKIEKRARYVERSS